MACVSVCGGCLAQEEQFN